MLIFSPSFNIPHISFAGHRYALQVKTVFIYLQQKQCEKNASLKLNVRFFDSNKLLRNCILFLSL